MLHGPPQATYLSLRHVARATALVGTDAPPCLTNTGYYVQSYWTRLRGIPGKCGSLSRHRAAGDKGQSCANRLYQSAKSHTPSALQW